jgi:hypothetical protein
METALSIIAIVISVLSGCFTIYAFIWNVNRDRKQATLDAYNCLQNEALDKMNLFMPSDIREIANDPKTDKYKEISSYIARIEHFCVGVNENIYDKKVVYKLAHGYLDSSFILNRINPIIDKKQKNADEDYYENIHKVLRWMKEYHPHGLIG